VNTPIVSSTFFFNSLVGNGLFFFIRASVKDRTHTRNLSANLPQEALLPQLQAYFDRRSYRIAALDANADQVTFEGFVRPSWFLAIFLTALAACGLFCLALVLTYVAPTLRPAWLSLSLLAPLAGWFYWQNAGRIEQVILKVEASGEASLVTVTAHRDELIALRTALAPRPEKLNNAEYEDTPNLSISWGDFKIASPLNQVC
jgi:hypothetical protein